MLTRAIHKGFLTDLTGGTSRSHTAIAKAFDEFGFATHASLYKEKITKARWTHFRLIGVGPHRQGNRSVNAHGSITAWNDTTFI